MEANAVEATEVKKILDVWEIRERYSPIYTISAHILYQLSTYSRKQELFELLINVPANQWSGT